mmetsp:Transcript_68422/g.119810  ORF Transcript_68422/g.119810 Transcript_68422/m.119810 type:complete len:370 (-) Transcript_68422:243-1352(-)
MLLNIAAYNSHLQDPPLPWWPYSMSESTKMTGPSDESAWQMWEEKAQPPISYDPPQFKGSCLGMCLPYLYFHRPMPPCGYDPCNTCCVPCVNKYIALPISKRKYVQITDPDSWFMEMLSSPGEAQLPEALRGVWWMKDNPGSETIACFNKTEWVTDKLGFQDNRYNWCHDGSNLTGSAAAIFQAIGGKKARTRLEIGPSGKWINLGGASWIYIIQPDDRFFYADGSELQTDPGDMMRLSYMDTNVDPSKMGLLPGTRKPTMGFQYMLKRIAYLDERRKLVKTPAYDELARQASGPFRKTCCGQLGCWNYSLDEVPPNDWQIVEVGGELPDGWNSPRQRSLGDEIAAPAQSCMVGCWAACSPFQKITKPE